MRLSACITLNDRPVPVMDTVFGSMRGQDFDEFVIVLDRTPEALADYCRAAWRDDARVRFAVITGEPGWRSPVTAWNRGFGAVTGDHIYCFSSETVQKAGNLDRARAILAAEPCVIQGKVECSCGPGGSEVNWGGTAPGNLFCDAAHPRPLGFIWAAPMTQVRAIDGYDAALADGLWYDDNDFFYRMWRTGLPFVFDDSVSGVHLHHDRPGLTTDAGRAKVARNEALMRRKHGTLDPLAGLPRAVEFATGRTTWRHIA